MFFSPGNDDTAAQELDFARLHFFLPHRTRGPFHTNAISTESFVTYDAYDLLMLETRDALGNRVTVGERDTNGNIVSQGNDYRVLQPQWVMDPNRNRAHVAFDVLGMVVGTTVMGKPEENLGDSLDGFSADLTDAEILDHLANPLTDPHAILGRASTRLVYDLFAYLRSKDQPAPQPSVVYTLARETHDAHLQPGEQTKVQHSFSYSDGFGREIQQKIQAEPGPLVEGGPPVDPRWVGSGWTVFNNKGKPVRQYEPFFTDTHRFEFDIRIGVSPVFFYDPAGRVIATLYPNHTFEKVIFDPWQQTTYDVNDTCAPRNDQTGDPRTDADIGGYVAEYFKALPVDPANPWQTWHAQRLGEALGPHEQLAATRAAAHADTPTTAHFDALGRPFLTVAQNRVACAGHDLDRTEGSFHTRVELDIEGNQRAVRDAIEQAADPLGRVVMRYAYDMLGNRIHQLSIEAGARWMLNDVAGKPIRAWDSRGHNFVTAYDALRRPVEQYVRGTTPVSDPRTLNRDVLVDKIEYGEGLAIAEALNLRTGIYRHFDSAGVATNARLDAIGNPIEAHDFKGNLLRSTRRLISDYTAIPDWLLNPSLDAETFEGSTRYDALNRPIQSIAPHSSLARAQHSNKINVIQPVFNEANLLERVDVWLERAAEPPTLLDPTAEATSPVGVTNIDYDAKGQRRRITYGNGVSTRYDYDPLTFRLTRLITRRGAEALQDLGYTYDPAGNITHLLDDAQQTIYFKNKRIEPSADYTYDALYQLIEATGREHLGQIGGTPIPHFHNDAGRVGLKSGDVPGQFGPNDGRAMGTYIERYVYDAVGNFEKMQHIGSDPVHPGWMRGYAYDETSLIEDGTGGSPLKTSNRLSSTTVGQTTATYSTDGDGYDPHGSMLRMPHLSLMQWDYRDQLQATARQVVNNGGTPETTYYVYDAGGQRVRKVTERQAAAGQTPSRMKERIYVGGFEIFREYENDGNAIKLERETLHVMDDSQHIALVEARTHGNDGSLAQLIRYQFGNHLGSASLEMDDQAQIISYEEYTPYGSTSYQAGRSETEVRRKRYRYTGMERDEESGFNYHSARYYMAWLGRWGSADPAGLVDGVNLYGYSVGNPVNYNDFSGTQALPKEEITISNTVTRKARYTLDGQFIEWVPDAKPTLSDMELAPKEEYEAFWGKEDHSKAKTTRGLGHYNDLMRGRIAKKTGATSPTLNFIGGIAEGIWEGATGAAKGAYNAASDPWGTAKGIANAVAHPLQTGKSLYQGAKDTTRAILSGDPKAIGQGIFAIGSVFIPVSKLGKLGKLADAPAGAVPEFKRLTGRIKKSEHGTYTHRFKSGMGYGGKGSQKRARQSGRQLEKKHNDRLESTDYTPAENIDQEFFDEALRIEDLGGVASPKNYNIKNTGTKVDSVLLDDFKRFILRTIE